MDDLSQIPSDPARLETVERILDAAERLFRHYGYSKTNVADVARDLSMSPANIYRFFSSKAEIHQAIARRMLRVQCEALKANAARQVPAADRLRDHLLVQYRMTVETMIDEEKVHEMVVVAMDQQWPVVQEHLDQVRAIIAGIIVDGIADGEFREQDPLLAAECFMCCGVSLCHPMLVAKKIAADEHITPEALAEFAIRALR